MVKISFFIFICLFITGFSYAQEDLKRLYLPDSVWKVPAGNNYTDGTSEYSFSRMAETDNVVAFWSKKIGTDPAQHPDSTKRLNLDFAMQELERFYDFYIDTLKFVNKGHSVTDKYKILLYIFGEEDHTAYGGGEDSVGILWTPPVRMNNPPYGALAHELGHSFQYLVNANGSWGFSSAPEGSFGQPIFEMTSQYMLWQVYPEWMTFENYHLKDFMKQTHYAFLHEINMYHSPYVLEYWSEKHGLDFVGTLWKEAKAGEDPVMAYKRLTGISQQAFNDEVFDAARRFVTWDMDRIRQVAAPYANQHVTELNALADGWYQIAKDKCPQNYGYNVIKLEVPKANSKITLQFEGLEDLEGFRSIQPENAGWRYGFLAVKENGNRIYAEVLSEKQGRTRFKIPAQTKYLWLVVSGAPTEHWEHLADGKEENDEQWPYRFKLSGTSPIPKIITPKEIESGH